MKVAALFTYNKRLVIILSDKHDKSQGKLFEKHIKPALDLIQRPFVHKGI
jgi:hypothetical protein